MANIALTTYCNLHCPYCFANTMIKTENIKTISLEQFQNILNWFGEDNEKIGLIGGEPTLHPQFGEILKIIDNYTQRCQHKPHFTLFTNGIYLTDYLKDIPWNMDILINVNQPQSMTTKQYADMIKNIQTLYNMGWLNTEQNFNQATLGCNICQEIDNYNFIWDICRRFRIKGIRESVVAPTSKKQLEDKEKYYIMMKPKFLKFVDNAIRNNVVLSPDCNQIPKCYFTDEEVKKINSILPPDEEYGYPLCSPVVDITPDFWASSCFGAYELINCKDFDNYFELERYLNYKVMLPKIFNNCGGKCKGCKKFELMKCQGGCLAFGQK